MNFVRNDFVRFEVACVAIDWLVDFSILLYIKLLDRRERERHSTIEDSPAGRLRAQYLRLGAHPWGRPRRRPFRYRSHPLSLEELVAQRFVK